MNTEYLSVSEYAELKGVSVQSIQKSIKDGKLEAEQTISEKKRPKYIIPVNALPENLKEKYYHQKNKELGLLPELKEQPDSPGNGSGKSKKQQKPINIRTLDSFTEDERRQIAFWTETVREWQACRSRFKRKTDADLPFCGKIKLENPDIAISPDILYKKYKAYLNNDLEGLVDNRGGWNKGMSDINPEIWSIFTSFYLTQNQLSVENCYGKTVAVAREHYPELAAGIPCSRTFGRRIKSEIPDAIIECGRKGNKAFLDKYLEYAERDIRNTKCNDIWIADNHTLDFFTLSDDGEVHRPSITTFQDAKSGIVVAAELCDHPNSDTTKLALRSAILQGYGIPVSVYFDNGSEFLTKDFGGRGHRKKKDWQKNEHPVQILSLLGISMINALPKNARAKPIERFFYTFKEHYSKSIESYCGGKPDERPEKCKELVKEKKLITDAELREILPQFIRGHNSELYGGKERRYKKMKRIDVWNESVRSGEIEFRTSDAENLNLLMMRTTRKQKIGRNGVHIEWAGEKLWYKDETTVFHINEEVYVRFDPADLSEVKVYDAETDKLMYTYPLAEYLDLPFVGADKEDIQELMRSQANTRKAVRKQLKEYKKYSAVSLLQAELLRAKQNAEGYEIAKPDKFVPVMADELKPEGMEITQVQIADIRKIAEFNEKMRGA